jgi:hypothetical protein
MSHLVKAEKEQFEDVGDTGSGSAGFNECPRIEPSAERQALSRFDWVIMPQMSILVLFAYLDRTNIGLHYFCTNVYASYKY